MGMAASQARLLCLTARIHDVEHQAQAIQNAKLQLATRSDEVYEEYIAALDATTLTVSKLNSDGSNSVIAATFNNLFSKNKIRPADGSNYALLDNRGRLIVPDEIFEGYNEAKTMGITTPQAFAIYMMCGQVYNIDPDISSPEEFMPKIEQSEIDTYNYLINNGFAVSTNLKEYYNQLLELTGNSNILDTNKISNNKEAMDKYNRILKLFRGELYKAYPEEVFNKAVKFTEGEYWTSYEDFKYYENMFRQIESKGGCVPISSYDGSFGNAANNSDWLKGMVESGEMMIMTVGEDKESGNIKMDATTPSSDSSIAYISTSTIDSRALAKAEAEYEHDLKEIEKKDKEYDLSLSKLETERQALTKEYDSVKNVIKENIERSFGIFS